ncbi:MAG TPA: AMP-binding protein, partial [Steroidobacteraceae bacterium]
LATTSLGAIWCSCALEHGAQHAIERLVPLAPKVLFTADGYPFAGERHERLGQVATALAHLPSVEHVIVTGYLDARPEISALRGARDFAAFGIACAEIEFVATPFDHPVYIVFASAAGGPPQGIVHGAGGTLLQHQKEQVLHTDLKRSDRLCCVTHCDRITWNWLASALATGATLVRYEGSPFHPGRAALWRLAESERVTIFGASAEYFDRLARCGFCPRGSVELAPLKTIFSTGSPLAPQQYDFIYQCVKPDVQLASVAAGADILCCVCLGNPVLPVYRGEVQSRGLGMRVEIVDQGNRRVRGEHGELVCSALIPSMPVGLWDDADGARYRATFFERYPDGWLHRDRAMLTEHDGIVMLGHSA